MLLLITLTLQALSYYSNSNQGFPSSEIQGKMYVALYSYDSRTAKDLSFQRGEQLLIMGNQEEFWWLARSLESQREGYIPKNFIAEAQSYKAKE